VLSVAGIFVDKVGQTCHFINDNRPYKNLIYEYYLFKFENPSDFPVGVFWSQSVG
jgi:hypothetical protein